MHCPDITRIAEQSKAKAAYLDGMPMGYLILSALAGVYLGFGITLIFSIGAPFAAAGSPAIKLVMGAFFGMVLALVIFAGSDDELAQAQDFVISMLRSFSAARPN